MDPQNIMVRSLSPRLVQDGFLGAELNPCLCRRTQGSLFPIASQVALITRNWCKADRLTSLSRQGWDLSRDLRAFSVPFRALRRFAFVSRPSAAQQQTQLGLCASRTLCFRFQNSSKALRHLRRPRPACPGSCLVSFPLLPPPSSSMRSAKEPYSTSSSRVTLSVLPPRRGAAFAPHTPLEVLVRYTGKQARGSAPTVKLVGTAQGLAPARQMWVSRIVWPAKRGGELG